MLDLRVPLPAFEVWAHAVGYATEVAADGGWVDLSRLGEVGPCVSEWWERCPVFWNTMWATGEPPGQWIATDRVVAADAQQRGRDLQEAYEALCGLGIVGAAVDAFLDLDFDAAVSVASAYSPVVEETKLGRRLTVAVDDVSVWPMLLGGGRAPGEVARRLSVEAAEAEWRDRRLRRLASYMVVVEELWPKPVGAEIPTL